MPTNNYSRREFIKSIGVGTLALATPEIFVGCNNPSTQTASENKSVIEKIELYRLDSLMPMDFSWGTWDTCQHALLKLTCGGAVGWSEMHICGNNPDVDIADWGGALKNLKNLTVSEALNYVRDKSGYNIGHIFWLGGRLELAEMALLDLAGRLAGKPSIELLGLTKNDPIPGLFCIYKRNPAEAKQQAKIALENNFNTHIKVKIQGDETADAKLIETVRSVVGPDAFLTADANLGYKSWSSLEDLAKSLILLHGSGLNACEDPADMDIDEWCKLQAMVGDLALIPDKPVRHSWRSINNIKPGMGKIYNLHPADMDNFATTVELAHKIQSWGSQIMIGDATFFGPACTAWQQIAIGLGAVCVESIEKPQSSKDFLECVVSEATYREENGKITMKPKPGFGLEIDDTLLKEKTVMYCSL